MQHLLFKGGNCWGTALCQEGLEPSPHLTGPVCVSPLCPLFPPADISPGGSAAKESACGFSPWVQLGRSPGEGKGCPLVFWPGEFHGPYTSQGRKESDTTERLSLSLSWTKNRAYLATIKPRP